MTSDHAATPPSPSTSFYDLSDDEEGEYNTITHARTGRGVKLLYSKSKASGLKSAKDRHAYAPDDHFANRLLHRFTSTLRRP